MKIGIMQPYLFPYLGYFQLIRSVDRFVIHDDVQYIKGGWINRNRILLGRQARLFTFSVKRDHYTLNINNRYFSDKYNEDKDKFMRLIKQAYLRAPFYKSVCTLLGDIVSTSERNISKMVTASLQQICDYLDIGTPFIVSSLVRKDNTLKGEQRVIAINKALASTHCINAIGGTSMYSSQTFARHNLNLSFVKTRDISYQQFGNAFVPNLSIIDVLMFNNLESIKMLLDQYDLI